MLKRLGVEWNELIPNTTLSIMSGTGIASLIKGVLIAVGAVAAVPVAAAALVLTYTPDIEYVAYTPSQELLELEVSETVADLLAGQLQIDFSEEQINKLIQAYIVEEVNPMYNPISGCTNNDCRFVTVESMGVNLGVNAVWVTLLDNQFIVNVAVTEVGMGQTAVARMSFLLIDNDKVFELKFNQLQTGFLPLPVSFFVDLIAPVLESNGVALSSTGSSAVSYSLTDLNIRIDKQQFIDESITNDVLASYASLIVEEELVQVAISQADKQVRLFVDQERLYSQTSIPLIPGIVEFVTALYLQEVIAGGTLTVGDLFN